MTLGALVSVAVLSAVLWPRAREAGAAGELAGAALVLGFWGAAVGPILGARPVGWLGVADLRQIAIPSGAPPAPAATAQPAARQ